MNPTAPATLAPAKTRFVVIHGNMLGYIDPRQPLQAGILKSLASKGAYHFWQDGPYPLRGDGKDVRPATREDFDTTFGVCSDGYRLDTERYDFPAALVA